VSDSFEISTTLPASPRRIYEAWLSSDGHSAFTGGAAQIDPRVGGKHSAWDGYIEGTNLELEPYRRIVQSWRTTDFPASSHDSRLEIILKEIPAGTHLILKHSEIPSGQGQDYEQGWIDNYFEPMEKYFAAEGDHD
jgi:uncharacterized protein YndB with AHSA1/START domain